LLSDQARIGRWRQVRHRKFSFLISFFATGRFIAGGNPMATVNCPTANWLNRKISFSEKPGGRLANEKGPAHAGPSLQAQNLQRVS
jgi:hypothetical protein